MRLSVSQLLVPEPPRRGTASGLCSVANCGYEGADLFDRDAVLESLTSNVTAVFDLASDLICPHCLAAWTTGTRGPARAFNRSFYATPGQRLFPVIVADSAALDRPVWSALLRQLDPAEPRTVLLTTDPKKRLWPFARVSQGDSCWLYLHDPGRGVSGNRLVSLARWRSLLGLVERVYALGFSKEQIATSLYLVSAAKAFGLCGWSALVGYERELALVRQQPEFLPALIVAQKPREEAR